MFTSQHFLSAHLHQKHIEHFNGHEQQMEAKMGYVSYKNVHLSLYTRTQFPLAQFPVCNIMYHWTYMCGVGIQPSSVIALVLNCSVKTC